jgi:hypothetical protein
MSFAQQAKAWMRAGAAAVRHAIDRRAVASMQTSRKEF